MLRKGGFVKELGLNSVTGVAGQSASQIQILNQKINRDVASCKNDDSSMTEESLSPDRFVDVDGGKYSVTIITDKRLKEI